MLYCYIMLYLYTVYIYYLLDVMICCYLSVVFLRLQKTIESEKYVLHRGERKESSSPFTLKSHQRKRGLVLASIWLYNVV